MKTPPEKQSFPEENTPSDLGDNEGVENDTPKKLEHTDLMVFLNEFQNFGKFGALYSLNPRDGICSGFSYMLLQAMLAGRENDFFERLKLIASYKPFSSELTSLKVGFYQLAIDIYKAQEKASAHVKLSSKEKKLIEMAALYDGIRIYQHPGHYPYLFDGKKLSQGDSALVYELVKPLSLEKTKLYCLYEKNYFFNKDTLFNYLLLLENALEKLGVKSPVLVSNVNHIVLLAYDQQNRAWSLTDINHLPPFSRHSSFSYSLSKAELVESLFNSLGDDGSPDIYLQTKVVTNDDIKTLECESAFSAIEDCYSISAEQIQKVTLQGMGLIHTVYYLSDLRMLNEILSISTCDVNQRDSTGNTPLIIACRTSRLDIVNRLLETSAIDINQQDNGGKSALLHAVEKDAFEIVRVLSARPDLRINDMFTVKDSILPRAQTILSYACAHDKVEVVEELLKRFDIDVNLGHNRYFPLIAACRRYSIAKLLLEDKRVNVNVLSKDQGSLFNEVCAWSDIEIVKLFLARSDLSMELIYGALYEACERGNADVVKMILIARPELNINQLSKDKKSALGIAIFWGRKEVVDVLLANEKIQVNAASPDALNPFLFACRKGHTDIAKQLLVNDKINVNDVDERGNSGLHIACCEFRKPKKNDFFSLLLKRNVNLALKNKQGLTAFDLALNGGNVAAKKAIFKYIARNKLDPTLYLSEQTVVRLGADHPHDLERVIKLKHKARHYGLRDLEQTVIGLRFFDTSTSVLDIEEGALTGIFSQPN